MKIEIKFGKALLFVLLLFLMTYLLGETAFACSDDLERIVQAETGDEWSIQQKANVAITIYNRVHNRRFPDTMEEVIFQKNAFSPINDGRFYDIEVSEKTKKAIYYSQQLAINNLAHEATFFANMKYASESSKRWFEENLVFLFNDGAHSFYKEKDK